MQLQEMDCPGLDSVESDFTHLVCQISTMTNSSEITSTHRYRWKPVESFYVYGFFDQTFLLNTYYETVGFCLVSDPSEGQEARMSVLNAVALGCYRCR